MQLKALVVGVAVAVAGVAGVVWAQQAPPAQPLTVHALKEGAVYWIEGGGGNTGVIIGQAGVVVVDAKTTADAGKQVVAEVAKLTPKPITHLIYTHSDGDHVNGAVSFPDGLTIIGHENEKQEMQTALTAGGRGAPPANRLPTQVVTRARESMTLDGVNITVLHTGPAHTNGDLVVYLPDQQIVFTGDIIATQRPDPIIHPEKNGSSAGWIETVNGILALNAVMFVPGHGDVQSKADIQKRLAATVEKRNKIAEMVKAGKSLDDIKSAVGDTPPAPAAGAPAGRGPGFASLSDIVYNELMKK